MPQQLLVTSLTSLLGLICFPSPVWKGSLAFHCRVTPVLSPKMFLLNLLTLFFILLLFLLFCNVRLSPQILLFPLLFSLLNHVNIPCGFSSPPTCLPRTSFSVFGCVCLWCHWAFIDFCHWLKGSQFWIFVVLISPCPPVSPHVFGPRYHLRKCHDRTLLCIHERYCFSSGFWLLSNLSSTTLLLLQTFLWAYLCPLQKTTLCGFQPGSNHHQYFRFLLYWLNNWSWFVFWQEQTLVSEAWKQG